MLERLKRFVRKLGAGSDDDPESFDHPRPQRVNADPPRRDWFARVQSRSHHAHAAAETQKLDKLDAHDGDQPALSREASQHVDDLLAKIDRGPARR